MDEAYTINPSLGIRRHYLHEHNYARCIPRRMPEPPDRDDWEKQREIYGGALITLLEDPS